MSKFLFYSAIISAIFFLSHFSAFADDGGELLLKSDFKQAYIQFNQALQNKKSAENYLNMCKVTYLLRDDDNAKLYCKEALNYIEKEKNPDLELKSNILSMLGSIYSTVYHNNDISFEYLNGAKEMKEANPETDKYELSKLYRNLAYVYNYVNNSVLSGEYYNKALAITTEETDKKYNVITSLIYNDLALIERRKQNYSKSKEYLEKGIELNEAAGEYANYSLMSALYNNMARYYEYNKHDKNSAIFYYKKAVDSNLKIPDKNLRDKFVISDEDELNAENYIKNCGLYPYDINTNLFLGFYYAKDDDKKSEEYIKKTVEVSPQNPYIYADIAYIYSILYIKCNKIESDYLQKAKEYIKTAENKGLYEADLYFILGNLSLNLEMNKQAAKYFKKYMENSDDKLQAVNNIQSLFDNKKLFSKKN